MAYEIAFFIGPNDENPIYDYLNEHEEDMEQLIGIIQRLGRAGQMLLDTKGAKPLGGSLFELRQNRHRIIYFPEDKRFVLLSAFLKNTNKTPAKELDLAQKRREEYYRLGRRQVMAVVRTYIS
jgi:phage-related protein